MNGQLAFFVELMLIHSKYCIFIIFSEFLIWVSGQGLDDDVHELKLSACKLLLAIIESRQDSEIYNRIYRSVQGPRQLLKAMVASYETRHLKSNEIETVGHSLYILLHQLSKRNPEIKELMTDEGALNMEESTAINFYSARKIWTWQVTIYNHLQKL